MPEFVQEQIWKSMNKMCCAEDPTSVYNHAHCLIEPDVQHISKIGKGLMVAYRILNDYKQIEFITAYQY